MDFYINQRVTLSFLLRFPFLSPAEIFSIEILGEKIKYDQFVRLKEIFDKREDVKNHFGATGLKILNEALDFYS